MRARGREKGAGLLAAARVEQCSDGKGCVVQCLQEHVSH